MGYLMAASYGTLTENIVDGNTQSWVTRAAIPDETAADYARAVLADLLARTVAHEKAVAAAAAAVDAITPILPVA